MTRQKQALNFIAKHVREKGYPPSVRELGRSIGLSVSTTQELLDRMEADGLIQRTAGVARSIRVKI